MSKVSSDGSRSQTVVAASVLAGTCFWLGYYLGKRQSTTSPLVGSTRQQQQAKYEKKDAPLWLQNLFDCQDHLRVILREWEDDTWRDANGWKGRDLLHNPDSGGVCVRAYFWSSTFKTLTGVVTFGANAESHRGLCHGGAMTSLMDDVCGHVAFLAGDNPWKGATVQVDCSLKKPVKVGDVLKVTGKVEKQSGKKVHITAQLENENGDVYVIMKGLSIGGIDLSSANDAITHRTWSKMGRPDSKDHQHHLAFVDSGWITPEKK